jgi:tetratricopeptide (TPR) repeat protein
MKKEEVRKILEKVSEEGFAWTRCQGYKWFKEILIPYITFYEENYSKENELISNCYYVIGDMFDLHNAPRKAIESYKKSIQVDKNNSYAFRELANMYLNIGEYKKSLNCINKSLELDPDDEYAISDKEWIQISIDEKSDPLFKKGDLIWECDELLANSEPEKALELLKSKKKTIFRMAKARCYGALFDLRNYMKEWEGILQNSDKFEINFSEWFYMPDEIYENSKIWKILLKLNKRIIDSTFISYDSLLFEYGDILNLEERRKLICKLKIYSCEKKLDELKKLKTQFPKWIEIDEEVKKMSIKW